MNGKILLALMLIMAVFTLGIISVKPSFAHASSSSSVPEPSVPEFTVNVEEHPFNVAPVTSTNPFTGNTTVTQPGYVNQNISLVFTIENQPYSYSAENNTYNLYYNIQAKGHFGQDWTQIVTSYQASNNSEYTVITTSPDNIQGYTQAVSPPYPQVDIQVEAFSGYQYWQWINTGPAYPSSLPQAGGPGTNGFYSLLLTTNATSGWSNTVTITVVSGATASSISASTTPYPTPTLILVPSSNSTAAAQNPTTGIQGKTGTGVNWTQIALFTSIAVIVALVIAVVTLVRKRNVAQKT